MDDPTFPPSIPTGPKPPALPLRPAPLPTPPQPPKAIPNPVPVTSVPAAPIIPKPVAPAQPKAVAPAAPKPPLTPTIPDEPVVIRTMKDDIQEAKSGRKVAPTPLPTPKAAATPSPKPSKISEKNGKPIVIPPAKATEKRGGSGIKVMIALIAVIIIGGIGAAAWVFTRQAPAPVPTPSETPKDIMAIIPSTASAIVEYRPSNKDFADKINQLWASQRESQPSFTNLLQGDPRFLLNNEGVQSIYFITLPNESAPYLMIPHNDKTASLVANVEKANLIDKSGWYVIHSSPVASYEQAQSGGTLEGSNILKTSGDTPAALYIYASKEGLGATTGALTNKKFITSLKDAAIWSDLTVKDGQIIFHGSLGHEDSIPQAKIDATMLGIIPAEADYVWLGSSLSADIKGIGQDANLLDQTIVTQPAVSQFLGQLSKSYVYYQELRPSGGIDLGLVVDLPTLTPPLKVGDKGIESALPALLPLLIGQKQGTPLAFSDATYNDVSLRYVNIPGVSQALDYAIVNNQLLVATSKDAMFNLIDTVQGKKPNFLLSGAITAAAQALSSNSQSTGGAAGLVTSEFQLLPGFAPATSTSFSFSLQPLDATTISLSGTLNQAAPPTPTDVTVSSSPLP